MNHRLFLLRQSFIGKTRELRIQESYLSMRKGETLRCEASYRQEEETQQSVDSVQRSRKLTKGREKRMTAQGHE